MLDKDAHLAYAITPEGMEQGANNVGNRMASLFMCLDRAAYAGVYANVSIATAWYGRRYAGWIDGSDPKAPKGDGGRGIADPKAHEGYALGPMGPDSGALVNKRVASLVKALPRDAWATLYAKLSIILAVAGGSKPLPGQKIEEFPSTPGRPNVPQAPINNPGPPGAAVNYKCTMSMGPPNSASLDFAYVLGNRPNVPNNAKGTFRADKSPSGTVDGWELNKAWTLDLRQLDAKSEGGTVWHLEGTGEVERTNGRLTVTGTSVRTPYNKGKPDPKPASSPFTLTGLCVIQPN